MAIVGSDPSRPRVGVVHEGLGAAEPRPEGQSVGSAALDIGHRSDVPAKLGFLCQGRHDERFLFLGFFDRPGTKRKKTLISSVLE